MPPKGAGRRSAASKQTPAEERAPPSSEDAKPNVDHLNAAASSEAELPSDPLTAQQDDPISVNTTPAPSARSTPSVQQIATPTAGTPAPGTSAPGKRPITAPRGAGRRSQAKREELQKADDERRRVEAEQRAKEDRAKAKQGQWRGGERGRGRGGRGRGTGRGGFVGESERHNQENVASGPFSVGEVTKDKQKSGQWRTSAGISRGSQKGFSAQRPSQQEGEASTDESGVFTTGLAAPKSARPSYVTGGSGSRSTGGASRPRTAEDGTTVKPDPESKPALDADGDVSMSGPVDGGFISSDEEFEEKINADRFNIENLIDLTGEDDQWDDWAPVRVMRVAHRERQMGINADGATNKDGAITVDANDAADAGTGKSKGKQKAKEEPQALEISSGSDKETEPAALPPAVKPDPEAPSAAEEIIPGTGPGEPITSTDDLPHDPPSSPESKRKAKDKIKSRTLSSTSESKRPDLQTQEEIDEWDRNQADLHMLRNELGVPAPVVTEGEEETAEDKRANKVYLFQFPPVLPDLEKVHIKPDPDAPAPTISNAQASKANADHIEISDTSNAPRLPSGIVGKLNIHKSGRATLDWGGTSFCVGMGAEASFLQDILVARVPGQTDGDGDEGMGMEEGVALSMGQVKGKFVVTPDWDEILG